jgi:RimJ/RimL family protein N-acetyltransferase
VTDATAGPPDTARLRLRRWQPEDAEAALATYGDERVARWLLPAMTQVSGVEAMGSLLEAWAAEAERLAPPAGRWAVTRRDDGVVVGGLALLPLPPGGEDIEIAWAVAPEHQGHGYATEAAAALLRWGLQNGADEVFAVSRPSNQATEAVASKLGMEWVGETEKYYDLRLEVRRVRLADLAH